MSLRLQGSTSGYVEIDSPAVGGNNTLRFPGGNGTAGQLLQTDGSGNLSWVNRMTAAGPAFSALTASTKSVANATFTEIAGYQAPAFDTASCFNATTGRFTPNLEGYYQFSWFVDFGTNGIGAATAVSGSLCRNGSTVWYAGIQTSGTSYPTIGASTVIYMNGTTDFVSVYVFQNTGGTVSNFSARLAGFLARPV